MMARRRKAVEQRTAALPRVMTMSERVALMEKEKDAAMNNLRELARQCDEHAEAFSGALKKLHAEIVAARQRNNGRGPSAILVWNALERCATSRFDGTVLRSLRGSPRVAGQRTFTGQVEQWLPMLTAPQPPPSAAVLTPPPAA
jgi:hypothetical protein